MKKSDLSHLDCVKKNNNKKQLWTKNWIWATFACSVKEPKEPNETDNTNCILTRIW